MKRAVAAILLFSSSLLIPGIGASQSKEQLGKVDFPNS